MKYAWLMVLLFFAKHADGALTTKDYCVRLGATVQVNPPQIKLFWPVDTITGKFKIYRKAKVATSWGAVYDSLPAGATSYIDNNVQADTAYEYKVVCSGPPIAEGYIYAGINLPATEYRGKILMVIDSLLNDSLVMELHRLMKDISNDGWAIQRFDISTSLPDSAVKSMIKTAYLADTGNVKAVLLVGHIAVPYSGSIYPDGHTNHSGAWPSDSYYGAINFTFTDATVNDTSAGYAANKNIPHDGKWDQSYIYGNQILLQVSRIDLSNMPAFAKSERQLLKSYLDKDHAYRIKAIVTKPRGLIDDNFGAFSGEAFAINGWRNFATILGDSTTIAADYISTLDTANYQWSYGCGGGSFTGAGGIGSTTNFATKNVKSIFSMMFGSYFGDWNVTNNFLRAPLCAPEPVLTNCWAGRPHWMFHHMGLGENIGYSTRLTQNNSGGLYSQNYGSNSIHIALMGDLTLRQNIIAPPTGLTFNAANRNITLAWTASTDSVLGYYVYRGATEFGQYTRISNNIDSNNTFTDLQVDTGVNYYMVRAIKLEKTPSGTYYNLSEGLDGNTAVHDTIAVVHGPKANPDTAQVITAHSISIPVLLNDFDSSGYPVFVSSFTSTMHGTVDTLQSNAVYTADNNYIGLDSFNYTICDTAGLCSSAKVIIFITPDSVNTSIANLANQLNFDIYPNPAKDNIIISTHLDGFGLLQIFDALGRKVTSINITLNETVQIDVSSYPTGLYYCRLSNSAVNITKLLEVAK